MKNAEPAALLLVDIGTLFTHVAYVESVLGEYRLVARTQTLSTLELPDSDPWIGILKAVRELEQITARSLTRDDAPIMPHMPDGSGIDAMIVVTSAAGTLPLVTAAIANDTTGSSLRRVAHASYTAILDMVTLDERGAPQLEDDESWIDYQLANLATLPAATILLAGGVDGGNVAPLERMAHMLAFTVLRRICPCHFCWQPKRAICGGRCFSEYRIHDANRECSSQSARRSIDACSSGISSLVYRPCIAETARLQSLACHEFGTIARDKRRLLGIDTLYCSTPSTPCFAAGFGFHDDGGVCFRWYAPHDGGHD